MYEDNKKEIAMKMLEKALGSIDFSRVAAIHLAFKMNSKDTEEHSEEPNEEEEPSEMKNNNEAACPACANNKENCKCG